jgi:hypothetical protein
LSPPFAIPDGATTPADPDVIIAAAAHGRRTLHSIHDVRWGGESRSGLFGRQCLDPVNCHAFSGQDVIASADKIVEDLAGQDDEFFAGGGTKELVVGQGLVHDLHSVPS